MPRRYRKIDTGIWNDEKFHALSDDGKLAFFFFSHASPYDGRWSDACNNPWLSGGNGLDATAIAASHTGTAC